MQSQNPYVGDSFYFANRTNLSFGETTFGLIHRWNFILATIFGLIPTLILFYLIFYQTPTNFRPYSKLLLIFAFVDFYFLCCFFWCQTLRNSLFYPLLFMKHTPSITQAFCYLSVPLIAILVVIVMVPISFCPNTTTDYGHLWFEEVPIPHLLVGDFSVCTNSIIQYRKFQQNYMAKSLVWYNRVFVLSSYFVAVVLAVLTIRELRINSSDFSNKTLKMQQDFSRMMIGIRKIDVYVLTLECLLTDFSSGIHSVLVDDIPDRNSEHFSLLNINSTYSGDSVILFISWTPCVNSLCSILLIRPYRRFVRRLFQWKRLLRKISTIQEIS
ncbi:hypothetical protein M3Y96_00390900 [Aphelenchoides besseyi]|nr:hypothetical protein M3Y96_00390900 [Aphelenchoides besseyi]